MPDTVGSRSLSFFGQGCFSIGLVRMMNKGSRVISCIQITIFFTAEMLDAAVSVDNEVNHWNHAANNRSNHPIKLSFTLEKITSFSEILGRRI